MPLLLAHEIVQLLIKSLKASSATLWSRSRMPRLNELQLHRLSWRLHTTNATTDEQTKGWNDQRTMGEES